MKQNWFNTLSESLASEQLQDAWDCFNSPIDYGQTYGWTWDDGSRYGRYISIYRDDRGMYERPVHYLR